MLSMLRISEAASLGMHAMVYFAAEPDKTISTGEIASDMNVSEAHLAKVFQRLARAGLLTSVRGPKGGFRLGKDPGEIFLIHVYEALEGPVPHGDCLFNHKVCSGDGCIFDGLLGTVGRMLAQHLRTTNITQLTTLFGGQNGS